MQGAIGAGAGVKDTAGLAGEGGVLVGGNHRVSLSAGHDGASLLERIAQNSKQTKQQEVAARTLLPAIGRPTRFTCVHHVRESLAATMVARSTRTLACFQVASSCILPSIMTAPAPSGMAAKIFSANFTSATSGENTRLAMATWLGCSVQAPAQPIRNELRNCASQAAGSEKSPNGP